MSALALLLSLVPQVDRPAPVIQPEVPPTSMARPPASVRLERDRHVAGRFTEAGQRVEYPFEARAGELSLFDLGNWGLSRGWSSTVELRVLGPADEELLSTSRAGGTVFREFEAFVAPADGRYRLEVSAPDAPFRFTLVRHSGFRPRPAGAVLPFGEAPFVHGYLADAEDDATYEVALEAGVPVLLRAALTHPQGEKQARVQRGRQPLRVTLGLALEDVPARGAPSMGGRVRGEERGGGEAMDEAARRARRDAGLRSFPSLAVRVEGPADPEDASRAVLASGRHAALLVPASDGLHRLTVYARSKGEGGLFDLSIERAPALVDVTGFVGDADDDPVAGITVHLLLEPGFDPVASTESDAEGGWRASVPPGPYTVLLRRGGDGPVERLQTHVEEARELNAIWPYGD